MTKRQRRQYEMLVRVRNFGNAHQEQFPEGSAGAAAFAAVAAAVAEIDGFIDDKLTARRLSRKEKLAARQALAAHIRAIARTARVMAKTVVGADAKFPLPTRQAYGAVLDTGRLFLKEVEPVKETFIRYGLEPTFVEELQQAVATFEQAIDGRSAGKTAAVVAQKGIRSAISGAVDAVQSLDVLIANTMRRDKHVLNAWKDTRHVELVGRSAPVGAPEQEGVPLPASPEEHPNPPATDQPSAPSADQPVAATPVGDPLRRAS